MTENPYTMKL